LALHPFCVCRLRVDVPPPAAALQAQRGVQYRLELFMSRDKGWGVQSWDSIKGGSLVCIMHGKITR
jgi:euchromatic histone-lysine N-methyltransferase